MLRTTPSVHRSQDLRGAGSRMITRAEGPPSTIRRQRDPRRHGRPLRVNIGYGRHELADAATSRV